MRKTVLVFVIILICSTLLGACQNAEHAVSTAESNTSEKQESSENETTRADIIEPEELISKDEAEAILGMSVANGEKSENEVTGQKICFYDGVNNDINGFLQISISQEAFLPSSSYMDIEDIFTSIKDMFSESLIPIDGLGDDAFLASGGYYILYRGYFISIYSGNTEKAEVLNRLDEASHIALNNLDALID